MPINDVHAHLLINHVPILGIAFGLGLLLVSFIPKLRAMAPAALLLLTLAGASAVPALKTGERAEEPVEHIQGVSERMLETHEEAAEGFVKIALLMGVLSAAAFVFGLVKNQQNPAVMAGVLLVAAIAMKFAFDTGGSGGKIRRPELRGKPAAAQGKGKSVSPVDPSLSHEEAEENEE